ncbi:MAG: hypothetical protein V7767_14130 [Leeuwenhoekiella sp.]
MKKIILLWALGLCISCSSDSPEEEEVVEDFNVELVPSTTEIVIDVPFTIKIQSGEPINEISINDSSWIGASIGEALQGDELTLHFQFGYVRNEEVILGITTVSGKKITKTLNFNVQRGNAVKITRFKINSFYNIDDTWDDEYANNDPNRLADVIFGFVKPTVGNFSTSSNGSIRWYISPVYPNQQQLDYDLSQENLYIAYNSHFTFGMADDDGNGVGQDLTRSSTDVDINIKDYSEIKPNEINIKNEEYGFDVTFTLEW